MVIVIYTSGEKKDNFSLYGIDYCQSLIDRANARLVGQFAQGDARDLTTVDFATDATFDVVVSFGVTQYLNSLKDVEKKFSEMYRVAKKGARIVCCEVSDLVRTKIGLTSQYIRPYCKTCVHYW